MTGAVPGFWGGRLRFVGLIAPLKPASWLAAGESSLSPFPAGGGLRSRECVCGIPYYGRIFLGGAVQRFLNLFSCKNPGTVMLLCLNVFPVEFRCHTGTWCLFLACGNMKSSARASLGDVNIQFCPGQLLVLARTSGGIAAFLLPMGRAVRPPALQDNATSGCQSSWCRK